ncbi:4'-phosphopantetheinyl transferase superfamily protein, partial [Streptomyces sp. 8K308]|uniref:4'-phosphopantetheinyl transferase superfamily protein n=1 Tax=Streptomyces sp. 8K308 TaxID=2530388 RepID=UPI0010438B51
PPPTPATGRADTEPAPPATLPAPAGTGPARPRPANGPDVVSGPAPAVRAPADGRAGAEPAPRAADVSEAPVPPQAGGRATPSAAGAAPAVWRVGIDEMPYLLDHCFFRQRPGWPDVGDRWPIVPATTVVARLMAIAERAAGHGVRAVAVRDVRLLKWIEAVPAVELPVTARRTAADEIEIGLTGFAGATVGLAPEWPAPPAPWRFDPATERAPTMRAERLYTERWMFHGPAFQGVTELTAIGDRHLRGVITAPAAPGALLDNVGQLLGYWIMASRTERTTVFPVRMDRITFHGPPPAAGARFECLIRIGAITESTLTADMQLVHEGRVWAEFTGWTDRRFDTDPGIRAVDRYPGRHILSTPMAGGWTLVHERWPDLATRELLMRNVLGGAERAAYEALPPLRRRQWLLGRIAAKDALRRVLWAEGAGEIYPAEIAVTNDAAGRPVPVGVHGRDVTGLTVSLAHRAEAGVAIAGRGPCGIDIEEITQRPRATVESACGPEERALLDRLSEESEDQEADPDAWFTRFWAAKEAVAKARGTGLRGRPAAYRVLAAEPDRLLVAVGDVAHHVRVAEVHNPPALPPRRYAVAWTTGDHPTGE